MDRMLVLVRLGTVLVCGLVAAGAARIRVAAEPNQGSAEAADTQPEIQLGIGGTGGVYFLPSREN